jgi:hypothetical protein
MCSNDNRNEPPVSAQKNNELDPATAPGLHDLPNDNVDQDGHCVTPAHAESVGTNTGAPCDDGRNGG